MICITYFVLNTKYCNTFSPMSFVYRQYVKEKENTYMLANLHNSDNLVRYTSTQIIHHI